MKKILFCSIAFFATLISCKKKSVMEEVPTTPVFSWPLGTSDYAPTTINSTFTFETSTGSPAVIDSFTYTVTKDTTISGSKFYKLVSNKPNAAPTYFSNYSAGVITNVTYNVDLQGVITIPVVTQTVLKDNAALNATWNDALVVPYFGISVNVAFVNTLLLKDYTKTILAKDYLNAIYVKQLVNISLPGGFPLPAGIPASTQIDNFFAKGVGLIQRDITGNTQKIKRFNIVK